MDFNFSPTLFAMVSQAFDKVSIILFSGVEISMTEGSTIGIAPLVDGLRNLFAPVFQAAFLFAFVRTSSSIVRNDGRFKVIGNGENQMSRLTVSVAPCDPLPQICRYPAKTVQQFSTEFH